MQEKMCKFPEVASGYSKEDVDDYIHMLVAEYEALQKELRNAKKEIRILKKKKKLKEDNKGRNEKDSLSYQETIAAAMMGVEASGKWIVEEAKKEALRIQKTARREVSVIKQGRKEALAKVKTLTRRLENVLKEVQEG